MPRDLSVLIPARNEAWLARTVDDVLKHSTADTEVIVVLDGAWPEPPGLPQHPKVTVLFQPTSIGQRAATNRAAAMSRARYVMKIDGHVALAHGFDTELLHAAEELGPETVQIPAQFNLHVYDQICEACGKRSDQAPNLTTCTCGAASFRKEPVWEPRRRTKTTTWSFDSELHFQYAGEMATRPEAKADIHDVMTSLGACFFMARERFQQLGGLDERHGSWGQYGVEVALKSWLSGGRHVVNKRTWFAHFFRVGGIGFPYPIHGSDQDRARKYSRDLWRRNAWPGQVLPLSWVLDKFWPVAGWSDEARAEISEAGGAFRVIRPLTDPAGAHRTSGRVDDPRGRQEVAPDAMRPADVEHGRCARAEEVRAIRDELQMGGVAARPVAAHDVVEDWNGSRPTVRDRLDEPGVHDSVDEPRAESVASAVAVVASMAGPVPASGRGVDGDLAEDPGERLAIEVGDRQNRVSHSEPPLQASNRSGTSGAPTSPVPSILRPKGVVYYTDCRGDEAILEGVRAQLRRAVNGHRIVSATLAPVDLGTNVVVPLERGYLTMFKQILVGLEAQDADYLFLAEHDVLYHPSHFDFVPPRDDTYYYNVNVWKVDAATGRALHYITRQTSGLCASRKLLLEHYRARVERVEREGFTRAMGFEPGTHRRPRGIDDHPSEEWRSPAPNVDIRHGFNLTPNRWRQDQFRNPKACLGWTEAEEVPGWGRTLGRFPEFLKGVRG